MAPVVAAVPVVGVCSGSQPSQLVAKAFAEDADHVILRYVIFAAGFADLFLGAHSFRIGGGEYRAAVVVGLEEEPSSVGICPSDDVTRGEDRTWADERPGSLTRVGG